MKPKKTFQYCENCNKAWEILSPPSKEAYESGMIQITEIVEEARRNTLDSFCIIVKNELRQQKLDGFSLDGTDFDAVFESAKKFILIKSIRI